jgi:hypothetical protein
MKTLTNLILLFSMILVLLLLFNDDAHPQQIGSTDTPYSTDGWAEPAFETDYYGLYIYTLLTNPGGWINLNTKKIDSLLNALVVFTDEEQLLIKNDTLTFSNSLSGYAAFDGTDASVTVSKTGVRASTDVIILTPVGDTFNANDLLKVSLTDNEFTVTRNGGGTSDLGFFYIWIRRYAE